jgi:hypothetical protein
MMQQQQAMGMLAADVLDCEKVAAKSRLQQSRAAVVYGERRG